MAIDKNQIRATKVPHGVHLDFTCAKGGFTIVFSRDEAAQFIKFLAKNVGLPAPWED